MNATMHAQQSPVCPGCGLRRPVVDGKCSACGYVRPSTCDDASGPRLVQRRGRPPIPEDDRKYFTLAVRFTDADWTTLLAAARPPGAEHGDLSRWCRRVLLEAATRTTP